MTDLFDREVRSLIDQCIKTLDASRDPEALMLGSRSPHTLVRNEILKYQRVYNRTLPPEHEIYFSNLYSRHRQSFLSFLDHKSWTPDQNVVLHYGEDIPEIAVKSREICINLSYVYRVGSELKSEAERTLSVEALGTQSNSNNRNLIRCEIILLHLFRIFYRLTSTVSDHGLLGEIVSKLETHLSVTNRTIPLVGEVPNTTGLGGVLNIAMSMLSQGGIGSASGVVLPSEGDISSAVNGLLSNPEVKTAISQVFDIIQSGDAGGAIASLFREANISGLPTPAILGPPLVAGHSDSVVSRPATSPPS